MYQLIHQNNDLTEVSGYPFADVASAFHAASLRLGNDLATDCVNAEVRVENGPVFACHVVKPACSKLGDAFVREGQMTLIAYLGDAADIAARLCRRHKTFGVGKVVILDGPPVAKGGMRKPVACHKVTR